MRYRFLICDVFTNQRFGGNQLAVLPEAAGLSDAEMQQIAREFNFSESTFVFPSTTGCTRQVRIFTPVAELPFAGHPNVGTAFVLATIGELGELGAATTVTFDEKAGRVPVQIHRQGAGFRCVLSAPEALSIGKSVDATVVAAAVSVSPSDIVTATHPPQVASVGLPFVFAEVRDRAVLGRMKVNVARLRVGRRAGCAGQRAVLRAQPGRLRHSRADVFADGRDPRGSRDRQRELRAWRAARALPVCRGRHVRGAHRARRGNGPAERADGGGRQKGRPCGGRENRRRQRPGL